MKDIDSLLRAAGEISRHQEVPSECPLAHLGRLLGGAWTLQVLWVLGERGPKRFKHLRDALDGVSAKVLTERLRRMESDRLLWRRNEPTASSRITYGLTEAGQELHEGLKKLEGVAERLVPRQGDR